MIVDMQTVYMEFFNFITILSDISPWEYPSFRGNEGRQLVSSRGYEYSVSIENLKRQYLLYCLL